MRLDIGAGDKREPGWISVDVATREKDTPKPDVVADITKRLPFEDNSVDEIRSIHAIEHIHRGLVPDVLKEWVRILKPGGLMAIECPDLIKAIYFVMTKPHVPRYGLWAMFGNPTYNDQDLMGHRWCYTTAELAELMHNAGLREIKEQEPLFHIKYRDLRLVGIK